MSGSRLQKAQRYRESCLQVCSLRVTTNYSSSNIFVVLCAHYPILARLSRPHICCDENLWLLVMVVHWMALVPNDKWQMLRKLICINILHCTVALHPQLLGCSLSNKLSIINTALFSRHKKCQSNNCKSKEYSNIGNIASYEYSSMEILARRRAVQSQAVALWSTLWIEKPL